MGAQFEALRAGFVAGNASAIHAVQNSLTGTWAHARSQRFLLAGVRDSDGQTRRIDFLGRLESFASDLRRLLALLNVSEAELTPHQRGYLNESDYRTTRANAREGFRGIPSNRYKIAQHLVPMDGGAAAAAAVPLGVEHQREARGGGARAAGGPGGRSTAAAAERLANATRGKIYERYKSDFLCLGYPLLPTDESERARLFEYRR